MSVTVEDQVIRDFRRSLPADRVRSERADIIRMLKDNSWLSPVVAEELERRSKEDGAVLGITAVVAPKTEEEVLVAAAVAARHRTPVLPRGAGTSNFGLLTPERGGVIFDLRGLAGECVVDGDTISAPAGTLQGRVEEAARAAGRELPVLTTTYATATIGGWVAGGHVGLGSSVHGAVWDDLVPSLRIASVEEEPTTLTLAGDAAHPMLHTFGAVAIATEIALRTDEARDWVEAIAFFPTFEQASRVVADLSRDPHYRHKVLTAQEEALMPAFRRALGASLSEGAGVLMIVDRTQLGEVRSAVEGEGGEFHEWQAWQLAGSERPSVAAMVYGHRMLWVKRLLPDAAFLHVYFDPDDPFAGQRLLKERFGDTLLLETKFIRSPWLLETYGYSSDGTLPASVATIADGAAPGRVEELMAFCDAEGIRYQNPHTSVIEDNGLYPDVGPIVRLKARTDPYNLLNPGKLRSAVTRTDRRMLDHVAIGVPQLETAIESLERTGGLRVLYVNSVASTGQRMAMMHDPSGAKLELIETLGEPGPTILHVALATDDFDAAHNELLAIGWEAKREPRVLPRAGAKSALVTSDLFNVQVISYDIDPDQNGNSNDGAKGES